MYVETVVKEMKVSLHEVHLLYELRYVTTRVGNLTQRKSSVSITEFPFYVRISETKKVNLSLCLTN
jgi:uncharacterized protein YlxP (DUF503 family)